MTELKDKETKKKSVVDDFFTALFANNNTHTPPVLQYTSHNEAFENNENQQPSMTTTQELPSNDVHAEDYRPYKYNDIDQYSNDDDDDDNEDDDDKKGDDSASAAHGDGRKRDRVLDEFDEYSLLSKRGRRGSSRDPSNFINNSILNIAPPPAVRPRIEAREIIQKVNNKNTLVADLENNELERPILAKRDIDWSSVRPESRMLVRQLPKRIKKQDVMSYFSKYGEVLEVVQKIPFGFVHFENPEACAQAVQIENGKSFQGIILELEICKRKPFFARAAEREAAAAAAAAHQEERGQHGTRNNIDLALPPTPRGHGTGRPEIYQYTAPSPPRYQQQADYGRNNDYRPEYGRRQQQVNEYGGVGGRPSEHGRRSEYGGGRNNQQERGYHGYRGRPYTARPAPARRTEAGYTSRYDGRDSWAPPAPAVSRYNDINEGRNGYHARYNDDYRYERPSPPTRHNNHANAPESFSLIPPRQRADVPVVQIVAWDSVAYGFTDYIERVFSTNQIRASSITLPYSKNAREEIVKQMILEGVKAIVMVDRQNETQSKVYLQVFAPVEHGQGVRYDEYDSVTAIEAVSIIRRSYPTQVATPVVAAATQPAVPMSTLAPVYNMMQQGVSSPVNNQQHSIPQLLATLLHGFNVNSPIAVPQQPNVASLISTASTNPAFAQLLAQMNYANTIPAPAAVPGYSPSLPSTKIEQQDHHQQ